MHRRSLLWSAAVALAAVSLTACGPDAVVGDSPSSSAPAGASAETSAAAEAGASAEGEAGGAGSSTSAPPRRPATAADYRWFAGNRDLAKGFTFVWVKGLTSREVMDRLKAKELERVYWHQLVGPGDGQRGYPNRMYFGVGRVDDWVLVIEDNGTLGTDDSMLTPLSEGTTVISHYRGPTGGGRLLVLDDRKVDLDFDPLTAPPKGGARAAELAPAIGAAGFGPSIDQAQGAAAAFALTERLTGVAMTEELLKSKTYLLSMVVTG